MAPFALGLLRAAAEAFPLPAPIVQFGSHRPDAAAWDLRLFFPGRSFLGVDERPGRGVDLVSTAEALPLADQSAGTFIAVDAFTRVRRFWVAFDQLRRVLRPDGAALLCLPFHDRLNPDPSDYWRFAPDAFELLLQDFPQRLIGAQGPAKRPRRVWAIAFGREAPPVTAAQLAHFRRRLEVHAQRRPKLGARLRAGVVAFLGGRRAAEDVLDQGRFEMEFHGPHRASALAA